MAQRREQLQGEPPSWTELNCEATHLVLTLLQAFFSINFVRLFVLFFHQVRI